MAQKSVTASVYQVSKGGNVTRLKPRKIFVDGKTRGRLSDGRPVIKIGDKWTYVMR